MPGRVPVSATGEVVSLRPRAVQSRPERALREDFARELEGRLQGWLGAPGSERRTALESTVRPYLTNDGGGQAERFDLSKLPEGTKTDLAKLLGAAEGIEAIFVKKLLSQMRNVSFLEKKSTPMADLAKDMMDQAIAEQTAKSGSSIGIARLVFLDTAQSLVRGAIAPRPSAPDDKP